MSIESKFIVPITHRVAMVLTLLGSEIEEFVKDEVRRLLACAIACGLGLPSLLYGFLFITIFWRLDPPTFKDIVTTTLLCLVSYLTVAVVMIRVAFLRRAVSFGWLFVPVCGSFLLVIGWWISRRVSSNPFGSGVGLFELLQRGFFAALVISMFALPFSMIINFSGNIVRVIRRWHNPNLQTLDL